MSDLVEDLFNMKVLHTKEMSDLKQKLADSERRLVLMWEHIKDNNKKTEIKLIDFHQAL